MSGMLLLIKNARGEKVRQRFHEHEKTIESLLKQHEIYQKDAFVEVDKIVSITEEISPLESFRAALAEDDLAEKQKLVQMALARLNEKPDPNNELSARAQQVLGILRAEQGRHSQRVVDLAETIRDCINNNQVFIKNCTPLMLEISDLRSFVDSYRKNNKKQNGLFMRKKVPTEILAADKAVRECIDAWDKIVLEPQSAKSLEIFKNKLSALDSALRSSEVRPYLNEDCQKICGKIGIYLNPPSPRNFSRP